MLKTTKEGNDGIQSKGKKESTDLVGGGLEKVGNHHVSLEEIIRRLFSDY